MKNSEKNTVMLISLRGLLAGIVASGIALLYWYIALTTGEDFVLGVERLGNLMCYAMFVVIFLLSFLLLYGILTRIMVKTLPSCPVLEYGLLWLGLAGDVVFVATCVKEQWVFSGWFTWVIATLVVLYVFFSISNEKKVAKSTHYILIIIFALFWGCADAAVNTFVTASVDQHYNIFHSSAYIDSIYNILHGVEFSGGYTDLYGHYALFFYLPLKLFGESTKVIAIILGIISFFTFVLSMSSFCMVVKSNTVRVVTIIVAGLSGIYSALNSVYWQNYPHRLFFPALVLFLIVLLGKRKMNRNWHIIGCIVLTMAVLWNTESGLICCLAWTLATILKYFQENKFSIQKLMIIIPFLGVNVVLPILLAFGIANGYNLLCRGNLIDMVTFFGLVNGDYMDGLSTPIEWGNKRYLHQIFSFFVCLCWSLLHNRLFGIKDNSVKSLHASALAVIGLGLTTYYVNRTIAGDDLVNLFFVLSLGVVLSGVTSVLQREKKLVENRVFDVSKLVLGVWATLMIFFCFAVGMSDYERYARKVVSGAYKYEDFQTFVKEIEESIPENTWTSGNGSTAIYMELGWDKHTYVWDYVTTEEIAKQDAVFLYSFYYDRVPQGFELKQEFTYGAIKFGYFVKRS